MGLPECICEQKAGMVGDILGEPKNPLLRNSCEIIQEPILSEMIRAWAQKSVLLARSRSCRPKVRVTTGQSPTIPTESPRKGA